MISMGRSDVKHYFILCKDTELEVAAESQEEAAEIAQLYMENCLEEEVKTPEHIYEVKDVN